MFKQVAEFVSSLLFLARDTSENKAKIAALESTVAELAIQVEQIASELRHMTENQKVEREKFLLQIENAFLKLEKRLPKRTTSRKK